MIFPSRKNVGGQSPMKIASLSARALSRQSPTVAERPQSEIAAAIEPKPRPCSTSLVRPSLRKLSAILMKTPFFDGKTLPSLTPVHQAKHAGCLRLGLTVLGNADLSQGARREGVSPGGTATAANSGCFQFCAWPHLYKEEKGT
jgi:hypothetical protein